MIKSQIIVVEVNRSDRRFVSFSVSIITVVKMAVTHLLGV